jgi:hypothetical protein
MSSAGDVTLNGTINTTGYLLNGVEFSIPFIDDTLVFNNKIRASNSANYACNKISMYGGGSTPSTTSIYGFGIAGSTLEYFSASAHKFYTDTTGGTGIGTQRFVILLGGNVGIGVDNPQFPLEVGGPGSTNITVTRYYLSSSGTILSSGTSWQVAMKVNGRVWVTALVWTSDARIKEDIQDINDDSALQMILAIEPKTYKYIDKIEKGDKKVYGFIAQQIREVIPEAVTIQKSYIPNVMLLADYDNHIITLPSQPNYIIKQNDKIKCYDKDNKVINIEVLEVIDELTFKIKELETEYSDNKIFIYGTEIDDFHTLDKSYIFTLNVCATQELHRKIKSQEARIKELETKMEQILKYISI